MVALKTSTLIDYCSRMKQGIGNVLLSPLSYMGYLVPCHNIIALGPGIAEMCTAIVRIAAHERCFSVVTSTSAWTGHKKKGCDSLRAIVIRAHKRMAGNTLAGGHIAPCKD